MTTTFKENLLRALVLLVCLQFLGCAPEDGLTPRLLCEKWEVSRVNGQPVASNFTWEFEDDGDFLFCYDRECYSGDWEWNRSKDEIDISYVDDFGEIYFIEFEVDVLDKEKLEGDALIDGELYLLDFEID